MNRLRVAVVGVGHLGQHHARILSAMPDVELVAVADARIEQARAIAAKYGCEAVADAQALLGRVQAVSIAVPTVLHRAVATPFLDRGIPTLVEKPLAPSLADAEALVTLARKRGAVLQVGHVERFNPALQALAGFALRPKFIAAERLGVYSLRSTDIGVILDLMIHDIDLVLSFTTASVRSVAAVGVSLFSELEDVANARIEFSDGCVALLTASRASYQAVRKMRLWGPEGYASLDFASKTGTLVRPTPRLRQGELGFDTIDRSQPNAVRDHLFGSVFDVARVEPTAGDDALTLELADFVQAAREGTKPRVSGEDAVRALRVADLVLQSLNTHRWEGRADGPIGPRGPVQSAAHPSPHLPAPKSLRYRAGRRKPIPPAGT